MVTFEGIEGCGKTTLLRAVALQLQRDGTDVVTTREPGGTALGDRIRELLLDAASGSSAWSEAFLANASRAQLVSEVIAPALRAGKLVLCDRFVDSTLAYQGFGRGLDIETLLQLSQIAAGGLVPDRTIVLDVPVELSQRRLAARENVDALDRFEGEAAAFHERVRAGYLTLAKSRPNTVLLDGALPVDVLVERTLALLAGVAA